MNGLSVFQIKVHNKYTAEDFDEDLRQVLRRSGCKGEKICFILDESNVLDSSFLERMNTLLANGEVPGLFEGKYYIPKLWTNNDVTEGHTQEAPNRKHPLHTVSFDWFLSSLGWIINFYQPLEK